MTKLLLLVAVVMAPGVAAAGKGGKTDSHRMQSHADTARKSASEHARKGNDASAEKMRKIADDRQRQADLRAKREAEKDKRRR